MNDAFTEADAAGLRTGPTVAETAEAALLGACLWRADAARALVNIDPADFVREAHRAVAETIAKMVQAREHIDLVTLTERMARDGRLEEAGDAHGLADLLCYVPHPESWAAYLAIVTREARRRRTLRTLRKAIVRLQAGEDPDVVLGEMFPTTSVEVAA